MLKVKTEFKNSGADHSPALPPTGEKSSFYFRSCLKKITINNKKSHPFGGIFIWLFKS